jgi:glycosyltransferase involved in cell wall biosynthesis
VEDIKKDLVLQSRRSSNKRESQTFYQMPGREKGRVITLILPDVLGGVYYNALNLADALERSGCDVSFVLTRQLDIQTTGSAPNGPRFPTKRLSFFTADNKHALFRKLKASIPNSSAVLVLNDWLDYKLVTHQRVSQQVIAIVHGDYPYYYELSRASESRIDQFVCVSDTIAAKLVALLPFRENDIVFIPPVVPDPDPARQERKEGILRIVFVGRLTLDKGFNLLPVLDSALRERGIACEWTVVAPHTTTEYDRWLYSDRVAYHDYVHNSRMAGIYAKQDIMLLPSQAEGFPLTILEAMKAGVVPLATKLDTLSSVIEHGQTGFLFSANDSEGIIRLITELHRNPRLLSETGEKARAISRSRYSEASVAEKWAAVLERSASGKNIHKPVALMYDRLDTAWLPNKATRTIRKWNQKRK